MRCMVTGASGFLGSYLVRQLLSDGHEVLGLVRPQSDLWRLDGVVCDVTLVRADMTDLEVAARAIRAARPDVTFHAAWSGVTGCCRNDREQVSCNVIGSLRLFELVRDAGCSCWIGLGSQAEYGVYDVPLAEDLPARPETAYGVAKLAVGLLTAKLAEEAGMRHVWARLLSTYGPKDDERHMIPSVVRQMLAGRTPALTPGEQVWDYLYVEDVAEALRKAAATSAAFGVFNLGSGEARTIRGIVETIRDLIDPSLPLEFGGVPYRHDQVMYLKADTRRFRDATGWRPTTSLEDGLGKTVSWYASDRGRVRVAA